MSGLAFEKHETRVGDGRRMALWTLASDDRRPHALPLVLGAGFARRMHHLSAVAMYGAHNGFLVSRYDPIDHIGLSDGRMSDFTMTSSLESMRAAVDATCEIAGAARVALIATSLTARVAYQLASQTDRIALIVTAVGVVNLRATLAQVFGEDHSRYDVNTLTGSLEFEGKRIDRRNFGQDAHGKEWWSLDGCVRALRGARQPITGFVGSDDTWVDPSDVRIAFSKGSNGARRLLTLERAPHDLSRDASVAHTFIVRTVGEALAFGEIDRSVTIPPFEEVMQQSLVERRIQRESPDAEQAAQGT